MILAVLLSITIHQLGITPEVWTVFLGFLIPPFVAFVKKPTTSRTVATIMVAAASLALGIIGAIIGGYIDFSGAWDVGRVLTSAGAAFTTATLFYNTYFASTPINASLVGTAPLPTDGFATGPGPVPPKA
jgi:hypothetical protein